MTLYAEIVLSLPVNRIFSYIVPEIYAENIDIGTRVLVPFGQRLLTGFVVRLKKRNLTKGFKLREIKELLDEKPVFTPEFISFVRDLSREYYSSWGELLQASLPPSFILKSKARIFISEKGVNAVKGERISREEKRILSFLQEKSYSELFLRRRFKGKNISYLISRLEKKGLIHIEREIKKTIRRKRSTAPRIPTQLEMDFSLEESSNYAASLITRKMAKEAFSPFLLFGPMEKREAVYFYLIREMLALQRKVLFLVPEISLTESLAKKFEKRFGENVALLHSRMSGRMREFEWRRIKEGGIDIVVGPRSALFSPLKNVGLVIVDEEQDESYYQLENPSYDARKGALLRAKHENSVVVYGSSAPSVESFYKAKKRGYLLYLEGGHRKNRVEIIDDRLKKGIISRRVIDKIRERIEKKEPVLVFFNRRGYASFIVCSKCDYIPRCIYCDIPLTYHKREGKLVCHYCNYSLPKMDNCPECKSRVIKKRGFGIEVAEEELKRLFPESKVVCFDVDVLKSKKDQERVLNQFRKKKIDILLGTQLLAHQVNLPSVTLVVILSPEIILTLSDYRASQKTFQSIAQMGNFVLVNDNSELLIQTAFPNHYSICTAAHNDYVSFYSKEIKYRRIMNYPPFSHMVEVLFQGENLRTLARNSRKFSSLLKSQDKSIEILGPAFAYVSKIRGKNRVQIILKSKKKKNIDEVLRKSVEKIKLKKSIFIYD